MPVKAELQAVIERDILLIGKFSIFEKGFTFEDERLGLFVVPYEFVMKLNFTLDSDWLEISMNQEGRNLLPAQLVAEESFYLQISNLDKLYHALKAQFEDREDGPTMEKVYGGCDRVLKSFSWLNL